jgi:LuxR family maltose regulon positive regulatory protein
MSDPMPLLATKLYIPPARPTLIPRPRLAARLAEGLTRPLTLISAPAGFGKTTLVSEWIADLRLQIGDWAGARPQICNLQSAICNRTAWLSLDNDDNDPSRFLTKQPPS